MPALSRSLELLSTAGRLRARHDVPEVAPPPRGPRAAVVCHPHPLHGGTMDNKVVHTLAKVAVGRGLHVVRFDFRGAGGSEGRHDEGRGERDDVVAALDHAAGAVGGEAGALLVAGFSFGSWVGLSVGAGDERVGALVAVAPPVHVYDYGAVQTTIKPLLVVSARDDELVPSAEVDRWARGCARPPRHVAVSGAGHLFHARLRPLREAVAGFLDALAR